MSNIETKIEEATHLVDEDHYPGSALGWNPETSRTLAGPVDSLRCMLRQMA
jgi:hypothetical protein